MKHIKILSLFAICLTMTACSSKDDYSALEDNTIKLNYTINQPSIGTRVGISGTDFITTTLPSGENVGLYFYEAGTTIIIMNGDDTRPWTYTTGANNTLSAAKAPTWGEKNLDILAVYPGNWWAHNDFSEEESIAYDQTTYDDYKRTDLMLASVGNASKTNGPITLSFSHVLSKIVVKILQGTSGMEVSNVKDIILNKPLINVELDLASLSTMSAKNLSSDRYDVKLGNFNSSGVTGIIPPQTLLTTQPFIKFKIGTIEYSYTPTSSVELKAGYQYTFNITIDNNMVKASSLTVSEWKTDDANCTQTGNATY